MTLKRSTLAGLAGVLGAHAGLELPAWVVESRAKERMKELGLDGEQYLALVGSPKGAKELAELVECVRVGETRFFRHRGQVDALLEVVIPAWKALDIEKPRVWSAGCASGEEPYTLALLFAKALPPAFVPSIFATDVSAEAIRDAKRAEYPASAIEHVPAPYRSGLVVHSGAVRIREDIAALVTFERQNLATAKTERGFDLVWCRNVLIYFEPAARRDVLRRLVDALAPGGFLFLGYSETLRDVAGLSPVHHRDQVLWQKAPVRPATPAARRPHPLAPSPSRERGKESALASPRRGEVATKKDASTPRSSRRGSVHIAVSDSTSLRADVAKALAHKSLGALTIDLDAAEFLDDEVAPVLRRACAAAEAAGIRVVLRAERSGAKRWLRRNGLGGGAA